MSRTVTALYDTRAEAEAARERLSSAVRADAEGINRGGFLVCAEVDGDSDPDRIVALLEESAGVDLDRRQETWRSEGWSPQAATGQASTTTAATGNVVEEERIPIVEEELRVGKREVERGGARVRSYIRETPVTEQVTLREEHVEVERRPVDRPVTGSTADATAG